MKGEKITKQLVVSVNSVALYEFFSTSVHFFILFRFLSLREIINPKNYEKNLNKDYEK